MQRLGDHPQQVQGGYFDFYHRRVIQGAHQIRCSAAGDDHIKLLVRKRLCKLNGVFIEAGKGIELQIVIGFGDVPHQRLHFLIRRDSQNFYFFHLPHLISSKCIKTKHLLQEHSLVPSREVLPLLNSSLFQNASFLVFLYQIHICFFWIFLPNCVKLNKFLFKF
ncbi:Uncharacterised protein [uncultured Blautia sp.]|nr:Uncharacterised protein [uncultured Blautia sp.]